MTKQAKKIGSTIVNNLVRLFKISPIIIYISVIIIDCFDLFDYIMLPYFFKNKYYELIYPGSTYEKIQYFSSRWCSTDHIGLILLIMYILLVILHEKSIVINHFKLHFWINAILMSGVFLTVIFRPYLVYN